MAWSSRVTRYSLRPISVSRRAWFAVVCSSGGLDGGWGGGGAAWEIWKTGRVWPRGSGAGREALGNRDGLMLCGTPCGK